jgi:hypothetical protein
LANLGSAYPESAFADEGFLRKNRGHKFVSGRSAAMKIEEQSGRAESPVSNESLILAQSERWRRA